MNQLAAASSLGLAFSDVLVDAIVVTRSRDHTSAASLQSLCWSSSGNTKTNESLYTTCLLIPLHIHSYTSSVLTHLYNMSTLTGSILSACASGSLVQHFYYCKCNTTATYVSSYTTNTQQSALSSLPMPLARSSKTWAPLASSHSPLSSLSSLPP